MRLANYAVTLIALVLARTSNLDEILFNRKMFLKKRQAHTDRAVIPVLTDDPVINVGRFTSVIYRGRWNSAEPKQADYIPSSHGSVFFNLDFDTESPKNLTLYIEFFENDYIEDKYIITNLALDLINEQQTTLNGTNSTNITMYDKIFSYRGEKNCTLTAELTLKDGNGVPLNITTDNVSDIVIEGKLVSVDCGINITFKATPNYIDLGSILIFTIFSIGCVLAGIRPLYVALRENNVNKIMNISDGTFLLNIMIDMSVLIVNTTIAMRALIDYFEFLTLITMFLMISVLFKIRFYLYIFETRVIQLNLDETETSKVKFRFMLKFIIGCIIAISLGNFLVVYYKLYYLLFLYPLMQIFHNCYNVVRTNCFHWDLHVAIILPQLFYPIALRSFPYNIFKLHTNYNYCFVLLSIVIAQLSLMFCQKYFSPSFFLPKFLIPNYYNYFRKVKNLELADTVSCPICFGALSEAPDSPNGLRSSLTAKKYMETPCRHSFHETCLKAWLEQKLICPCCRAQIPPY